MANYNCQACSELREDAPNLVVNGFTATEETSLKNDTGLNPSSGNNDCTDLNNMNDCLIGNMVDEIDAYDVCDWKDYTKNLVDNIWTVFKGIICAICGLWTRIHKIDCVLGTLDAPQTFVITRDNITLAPDVSYRSDAAAAVPSISGNAYTAYITGGLKFGTTWTDSTSWLDSDGDTADGGRLVYTYKIHKDTHKILAIWPAPMMEANAGSGIIAHLQVFNEGETAWGYASKADTTGAEVVPSGYIYAQVRLMSIAGGWGAAKSGSGKGEVTLCGVVPVLMNVSASC